MASWKRRAEQQALERYRSLPPAKKQAIARDNLWSQFFENWEQYQQPWRIKKNAHPHPRP